MDVEPPIRTWAIVVCYRSWSSRKHLLFFVWAAHDSAISRIYQDYGLTELLWLRELDLKYLDRVDFAPRNDRNARHLSGTEQLISIVSDESISFEARYIATFLLGGTSFQAPKYRLTTEIRDTNIRGTSAKLFVLSESA